MGETDDTDLQEQAAVYRENSDGTKVVRGYNAVDPQGHLVVLPPGTADLKPGWRWATAGDLAIAEAAAKRAQAAAKQKAQADAEQIRHEQSQREQAETDRRTSYRGPLASDPSEE